MRKIILLTITVLTVLTAAAQDFSNKGKDFWLCFPQHVPAGGSFATLSIFITSDRASTGTITMPNGAFSATFNITANGLQEIQIPWNAAIHISNTESSNEGLVQILSKSIRIKTDPGQPAVVAYAQQWAGARSAATLLLPVNVLGKKYFAMSFNQVGAAGSGYNARSQFQIIATKPNTVVDITPVKNGAKQATFTVNLPLAGDMIQYQSPDASAGSQDLTGTIIESKASGSGGCLPISVFSGSSNIVFGTSAPFCNGGSYDPLWQQLYPATTWGKNFGFMPFEDYPNGNPYRVMASEDNTNIFFNGTLVANLNEGQIYPAAFTRNPDVLLFPTNITADKPICVAQYAQASSCTGQPGPQSAQVGDPDMVILNPIEQNISDITIFTSNRQNISKPWINVLIETVAAPSFRINGLAPTTAWQPFPAIPGYSYLRHLFPTGANSYRLTADSGFNAICYGWGNVESYAYSAGTNVRDLYQQIGVSTQYGIETTPSVCTNSPFRFKVSLPYCADSIRWDLSNLPGPPVPPFDTIRYTTCVPGAGGPDSTTIINGVTLYWYSLPTLYSLSTVGIFPVTISSFAPNSSGCGSEQLIEFDLTVSAPPVADFAWTAGGCVAEPFQFTETTPQVPKPTYRWWWDFGDPASGGANNSLLRNPGHTFTAPGTYTVRYSSITTPGCLSDTISHTVVVNPLPAATIIGNNTVCINTAPAPVITFTGTDGTPPYTFTYTINGGAPLTVNSPGVTTTATINAPTNIAGPFVYNLTNVRNVGSALCTQAVSGQSVTVNITPDATVTLTSAAGTNAQTVCINNAITNITYAVGGSGTGGSVSGLPAGVTGSFAGGVVTITGTPAISGTFPYTVSTTGPCVTPTATGTITVTADATIALTSAAGSDNQTLCINTALPVNITYAVGGTGNGGSVTGLPAGVTGVYAAGIITISGTPSVSGVFSYTVLTTGPCVIPTATGTITVTADATVTLTSAAGTNNQSLCINVPITNITYAVGGTGTGGSVTGLPPGVTGVYAGGIITISGTPTSLAGSPYTYTVFTTGPCVVPTATGTITVNPDASITLTSAGPTTSQELCRNSTLINITYSITGGGTGGTVTGLPAGVTGVYAGGIFTISGAPTVAGTFNYTVNTTGTCIQANASGSILVNELPTAAFSFTIPSCETRVINFTDLSVPNVGILTNWSWDFGDGSPLETMQNPTHVYTTAAVYNATLTVTTDKGCVSDPIAAIAVTINDRPEAGFIIPEVCLSDTYAQFIDTSKIAAGTVTGWQWNFGDPGSGANNTSILQNPTHSYSAVGPYNVELIVTSNNGCRDTIVQQLFVNGSFPVADFVVNNPAALCANDSVAIVEASTVFPGVITRIEIYWDNAGFPGVFETDNSPFSGKIYRHLYPNFQAPLTRVFSIRYRAYSGGVCVNDKIADITVNAAPLVQFNAMPDACLLATPFQITQATEIGGVPGTAVFTGPGVSSSGIFTALLAGIGTHTIMYTFTSSAGGCVDTMSNNITVLDTATASFSFVTPICQGNPASFTELSTAPGTVTLSNTTWDFGDGTPFENHLPGTTFDHVFPGTGTYNVSMYNTSAVGCRSTTHTLPVTVSPAPVPNFAVDKLSYCIPNAIVKFNNSSSVADGSGMIYAWDFNDPLSGPANTSTAFEPTHWFTGTGPFNVNLKVTSGIGCIHDTTIIVNNIHPQPIADFTFNKPGICIGDNVTLTDNTDGKDGIVNQWNWQMGDGNTMLTNPVTYTYFDTVTYNITMYTINTHGCNSDTISKSFTVYPYPHVNAGPDRFVLEGGSILLETVTFANDPQYAWTPDLFLNDSRIPRPRVNSPLTDMTYRLTVTARGGCVLSDDVFVKLLKFPVIPNTFTPNNDGINDKWRIDYLNTYPNNRVQIFTRNGNLVFESRGYDTPWDGTIKGKPLPFDTYYYIIEPGNGRDPITGYVTIIK